MNPYQRLVADQQRRQRLWAPTQQVADQIEQDIAVTVAQVTVPEILRERAMANTGARGFAAIVKARAAKLKDEFSKIADDINGEFDAQDGLLTEAKSQHAEMKKDTAELRDALGLGNNPPT